MTMYAVERDAADRDAPMLNNARLARAQRIYGLVLDTIEELMRDALASGR